MSARTNAAARVAAAAMGLALAMLTRPTQIARHRGHVTALPAGRTRADHEAVIEAATMKRARKGATLDRTWTGRRSA